MLHQAQAPRGAQPGGGRNLGDFKTAKAHMGKQAPPLRLLRTAFKSMLNFISHLFVLTPTTAWQHSSFCYLETASKTTSPPSCLPHCLLRLLPMGHFQWGWEKSLFSLSFHFKFFLHCILFVCLFLFYWTEKSRML